MFGRKKRKRTNKEDGEIRQKAGCSVKYGSLSEKDICAKTGRRGVSNANGDLGSGRAILADTTACAKALRQEHVRCIQEIARRPTWLEQSSRWRAGEGRQHHRSKVEMGNSVSRPL